MLNQCRICGNHSPGRKKKYQEFQTTWDWCPLKRAGALKLSMAPVILALKEEWEFEATLGYKVSSRPVLATRLISKTLGEVKAEDQEVKHLPL